MIDFKNLYHMINCSLDAMEEGKFVSDIFEHSVIDSNNITHRHKLVYIKSKDKLSPLYSYRSNSASTKSFNYTIEEYNKDASHYPATDTNLYISMDKDYKSFALYPNKLDDIKVTLVENNMVQAELNLNDLLHEEYHFQTSTIYNLPSYDLLYDFSKMIQKLRGRLLNKNYKIVGRLPTVITNNYSEEFLTKIIRINS